MTLTLHHLDASRSQRVVWLLEELGAPYELVSHARDPETRLAPAALREVHPLGKSPLLVDDGRVIAETGAIAEYLLARHDPDHRLHPRADDPDFPRYLEWLHSAEGAPFLPGLMEFYLASHKLGDSALAAKMRDEAGRAVAHIEAHLARHTWFAGENFSAADCLMGFQLSGLAARTPEGALPAIRGWLARAQARPAYGRMLAKGI
ncbi:MAG: glutathione S-transferase family protein [Pseudomonadota bacterium]|nr:glutathione S-transferase family protein [Pseudomonadota bacterium]MEE3098427.1 glutathione S-transferase family protein [Pseudomonadota bacterium]